MIQDKPQPHSSIMIRDAEARDLPEIQRIYAHHVLHGLASFDEEPPDLAEIARRHDAVRMLKLPYLVVDEGGRVQGYAYAALYRPRSAYRFTLEDSIYVDNAARGKGIGRSLLTELIERCTRLGYRQMLAVIGDSANTGSIRLHAALGFGQAALLRSVGFKFGRWVDSVVMQRALGPGDSTLPAERR